MNVYITKKHTKCRTIACGGSLQQRMSGCAVWSLRAALGKMMLKFAD